ncbi:hypothetical protein F4810DRAFT_710167 [Camillea tinctor]|nr:hypothetical protein F4810DRAFT_710167 [Camillea tinctor]
MISTAGRGDTVEMVLYYQHWHFLLLLKAIWGVGWRIHVAQHETRLCAPRSWWLPKRSNISSARSVPTSPAWYGEFILSYSAAPAVRTRELKNMGDNAR